MRFLSHISFLISRVLRQIAIGHERIGRDLGRLAAGDAVVGAEIGAVAGRQAWFAWEAARVTADITAISQTLYKVVECATWNHILEDLCTRRIAEASRI